eukprot:6745083-Alexandrium_andersonii.AAC.1
MSASLVGSEMCIRDSALGAGRRQHAGEGDAAHPGTLASALLADAPDFGRLQMRVANSVADAGPKCMPFQYIGP